MDPYSTQWCVFLQEFPQVRFTEMQLNMRLGVSSRAQRGSVAAKWVFNQLCPTSLEGTHKRKQIGKGAKTRIYTDVKYPIWQTQWNTRIDYSFLALMWNNRFGYFTFFVGEITELTTNPQNELSRCAIIFVKRYILIDLFRCGKKFVWKKLKANPCEYMRLNPYFSHFTLYSLIDNLPLSPTLNLCYVVWLFDPLTGDKKDNSSFSQKVFAYFLENVSAIYQVCCFADFTRSQQIIECCMVFYGRQSVIYKHARMHARTHARTHKCKHAHTFRKQININSIKSSWCCG